MANSGATPSRIIQIWQEDTPDSLRLLQRGLMKIQDDISIYTYVFEDSEFDYAVRIQAQGEETMY